LYKVLLNASETFKVFNFLISFSVLQSYWHNHPKTQSKSLLSRPEEPKDPHLQEWDSLKCIQDRNYSYLMKVWMVELLPY